MKKIIMTGAALLAAGIVLPRVLKKLGLHPDFESNTYPLQAKRALIITTSHDTLGDSKKKIGVFASEMTVPYFEFIQSGMTVDIASIKGGKIPVEAMSLRYPIATHADRKYLKDDTFMLKTQSSLTIDEVDISKYDIIFVSGGWGAAYDLGQSQVLGNKISQAYNEEKLIGAVCHGPLAFLKAVKEDGSPLVKDLEMTAVTDKQIKELHVTQTPLHPETELRKLGADFKSNTAFTDILANKIVVDGNIVTGQNQNAGGQVANTLMKLLADKSL